ncbi:hypothetical protein G7054_g1766 [Neopestalotiopsis clavispora]|nr:hypothetical protein G7054_g1766 [Neopestalotiopsis clavispora]
MGRFLPPSFVRTRRPSSRPRNFRLNVSWLSPLLLHSHSNQLDLSESQKPPVEHCSRPPAPANKWSAAKRYERLMKTHGIGPNGIAGSSASPKKADVKPPVKKQRRISLASGESRMFQRTCMGFFLPLNDKPLWCRVGALVEAFSPLLDGGRIHSNLAFFRNNTELVWDVDLWATMPRDAFPYATRSAFDQDMRFVVRDTPNQRSSSDDDKSSKGSHSVDSLGDIYN